MLRRLVGFALLALVAVLLLKVLASGLGLLIGLAVAGLWLAGLGFIVYLALRLFSPVTADALCHLLLREMRREAERRWRENSAYAPTAKPVRPLQGSFT